jgi:PII-like signaling protein
MMHTCLKFYVTERQKHDGKLMYEWFLERAKALGIPGGTALRAIAGYGRHGVLHEETFFELAGDLPVEIEFVVDDPQADALMALLRTERLQLYYTRMAVEAGVVGEAGQKRSGPN